MAFKTITDPNELPTFGRRLFLLGKESMLLGPIPIATALYMNNKCYALVRPRTRDKKHSEFCEKDISAIARRIQEHFNTEEAYKVPSNYLYAYSLIFECSMDYLYGNTDIKSNNLDVRPFCEKTDLPEKAVVNLFSKHEIYLGNFLFEDHDYHFPYGGNDPYIHANEFWGNLLQSELFEKLPEAWYHMAIATFFYRKTQEMLDEAKGRKVTMPTREDFIERFTSYYYSSNEVPPMGLSLEELYDSHPDIVLEMVKDLNHKEWYELSEDIEKRKTVSWGCSGMFDRLVENHFHELADAYTLPDTVYGDNGDEDW